MKKIKILIIGRIPPPIGGVTIYVNRLLYSLNEIDFIEFSFLNLSWNKIYKIPFLFLKYGKVHLNTTNSFAGFIIILLSNFFFTRSMITFHFELNRKKWNILNYLDFLTIKMADYPIVLNVKSHTIATSINKNSKIMSPFIVPIENMEILKDATIQEIKRLKKKYEKVFCTNAFSLVYDLNGLEIYGIFEIIDYFIQNDQNALIISDPSGTYKREFEKRRIRIDDHILIINEQHSFYQVLKLVDGHIRNTTTDGDSISVRESLYLGKPTFCTDVVDRPYGCILYKQGALSERLNEFNKNTEIPNFQRENADDLEKLIELYKAL